MKNVKFLLLVGVFALFTNSKADTASVITDQGEFRFWYPSKGQVDTLGRAVKIIDAFEDSINSVKKTASSYFQVQANKDYYTSAKEDEATFLHTLKAWRNNRLAVCASIVNNDGGDDCRLHAYIRDMVSLAIKGDLPSLQAIIIANFWPRHSFHVTQTYVPIWSEEQMAEFYRNHPDETNTSAADNLPPSTLPKTANTEPKNDSTDIWHLKELSGY
jgi:hypothetical protein